jgi:heptosyltransferase-2
VEAQGCYLERVTRASRGPLVVRLRNWVGDVVLSVPTLRRLEQAGYELHLVGKGWAADLLGGYGWKVHRLAPGRLGAIRQLRELRRDLGGDARLLIFPYSFGSALEARAAGFSAVGFGGQARGWLLGLSVPQRRDLHTREEYWSLGQAFLGLREPPPAEDQPWAFAPSAEAEAEALVRRHGLQPGYVVICPFAGGKVDEQLKRWPHFADFARGIAREGRSVVICPGSPREEEIARAEYPDAKVLAGVGMSAYGVLMRRAALVVSNDTGPGHLAAAAGAKVLSVFGPTSVDRWRTRGPRAEFLQGWPEWPASAAVLARSRSLLDA